MTSMLPPVVPCMPAVQEGKDVLSPPAPPHSLALATAGNDALKGFVCDSSPARLETGNIPSLDSTMTSSSPPAPSSLLMVWLGGPAMPFSVYS